MRVTYRELSSILYGLREMQDQLRSDSRLVEGAVHFIDVPSLTDEEIDDLCERLNCDPEPLLEEPGMPTMRQVPVSDQPSESGRCKFCGEPHNLDEACPATTYKPQADGRCVHCGAQHGAHCNGTLACIVERVAK